MNHLVRKEENVTKSKSLYLLKDEKGYIFIIYSNSFPQIVS